MNYTGTLFGIYVFLTIGLYHVLIVKLERRFGVWPWLGFLVAGLACICFSLVSSSVAASMWWGYNAFINLWSIKEMFEQQQRSLHA